MVIFIALGAYSLFHIIFGNIIVVFKPGLLDASNKNKEKYKKKRHVMTSKDKEKWFSFKMPF